MKFNTLNILTFTFSAKIKTTFLIPNSRYTNKSNSKKYVDGEAISDTIGNFSKGILEQFEKDIHEYNKRKESIEEFKNSFLFCCRSF